MNVLTHRLQICLLSIMVGMSVANGCKVPEPRFPVASVVHQQLPEVPSVALTESASRNSDGPSLYHVDLSPYTDAGANLPITLDASMVPLLSPLEVPDGALIAQLPARTPAPFNGVLFNGTAVAYIDVSYRAVQTQCAIARQTDLRTLSARALADIAHLQERAVSRDQELLVLQRGRDEEIARLNRLLDTASHQGGSSFTNDLTWFGVGTGFGAGLFGLSLLIYTLAH